MVRLTIALLGCVVLALAPGCSSGSAPASSAAPAATYRNPVFRHDAPDPSVIRAPDGTYYAYTTQSIYLDLLEIPVLASRDLVHWRKVGDAFRRPPPWVLGGPAGDMWAPHILRIHGRYLLYYAGRRLAGGDMAIGVAWSPSPRGPFHDLGHPLLTRSPGQPPYTAIDPFVLAASGRLFIYWGSNDEPIRVARLAPNGLHVAGPARPLVFPVPAQGPYGGLVEGPWVLRHRGLYYLMYSVGDCCSEHANYSVYVARSRSPMGPFEQGPDNPILHANRRFWAVGHNATIADVRGHDWIVYHARVRGSFSDDRELMLDRIVWRNGWPSVNGGQGPTSTAQPAPATAA
jgi:arabinan endo-1,5-alpha-L-arabinosidase